MAGPARLAGNLELQELVFLQDWPLGVTNIPPSLDKNATNWYCGPPTGKMVSLCLTKLSPWAGNWGSPKTQDIGHWGTHAAVQCLGKTIRLTLAACQGCHTSSWTLAAALEAARQKMTQLLSVHLARWLAKQYLTTYLSIEDLSPEHQWSTATESTYQPAAYSSPPKKIVQTLKGIRRNQTNFNVFLDQFTQIPCVYSIGIVNLVNMQHSSNFKAFDIIRCRPLDFPKTLANFQLIHRRAMPSAATLSTKKLLDPENWEPISGWITWLKQTSKNNKEKGHRLFFNELNMTKIWSIRSFARWSILHSSIKRASKVAHSATNQVLHVYPVWLTSCRNFQRT